MGIIVFSLLGEICGVGGGGGVAVPLLHNEVISITPIIKLVPVEYFTY